MDQENHDQAGEEEPHRPHVLMIPFSAQGHVTSMLRLAELFSIAGLRITFLVTDDIHDRLLRHSDVHSHFARYSGFRFQTIPNGLPEDQPRDLLQIFRSMTKSKPLFRELLVSSRRIGSDAGNRITCVVADGLCMSFAIDIGEEVGIPIICFDSTATCNFWINLCFPKLVGAGEFPFKGNDLDTPITSVPGMEHFLRCRDYTSFCRNVDSVRQKFQIILNEVQQSVRAQALIFNTFEDLEGPILIHARSQCPNIYTIGPLHAHIKSRLATAPTISSNTLWEEDASCLTWLESKPSKSVIYVSFGSIAMVTKDQLIEFWHGLINSGKRFLWVIRSDFIDKKSQIPTELLEDTKERGYIVGWAPQEKVLAHRAIGGFLTHSGWNSTLESIVAGVPMICWPYFGDQQINSRFVGEVWKLGLDMKDTCDRVIIEKMIRDLMDERRDDFTESTGRMAELAKQAISIGGSSYNNFDRLIGLIRSMDDD